MEVRNKPFYLFVHLLSLPPVCSLSRKEDMTPPVNKGGMDERGLPTVPTSCPLILRQGREKDSDSLSSL